MWNKDRSIILSQILVKVIFIGIIVCCFIAPDMVKSYDEINIILTGQQYSVFLPLIITLYCCVPPALTALICLDMLLMNIRKNQPFIRKNVAYLRIISYCCFIGAVIFIYFSTLRPVAWIIVAAAGFFGLILRVVKNCFQQAVAIREENDFTI